MQQDVLLLMRAERPGHSGHERIPNSANSNLEMRELPVSDKQEIEEQAAASINMRC